MTSCSVHCSYVWPIRSTFWSWWHITSLLIDGRQRFSGVSWRLFMRQSRWDEPSRCPTFLSSTRTSLRGSGNVFKEGFSTTSFPIGKNSLKACLYYDCLTIGPTFRRGVTTVTDDL